MSVFLADEARERPGAVRDFHFQDMKTLLGPERGAVSRCGPQAQWPTAEWRSGLDFPTEAVARAQARAADLIIIGNERENQDPLSRAGSRQLSLKAGRPVLVVPKGVASFSPKRIAVSPGRTYAKPAVPSSTHCRSCNKPKLS